MQGCERGECTCLGKMTSRQLVLVDEPQIPGSKASCLARAAFRGVPGNYDTPHDGDEWPLPLGVRRSREHPVHAFTIIQWFYRRQY